MYQIIMLCILSKMRMKNATFTVWAQLTFVQGGKHRELVAAFQEPESPAESSCEAILSPTPDCPAHSQHGHLKFIGWTQSGQAGLGLP